MGAQSIRIPIELELKNMQGAIGSLKSTLSNLSKNSGLSVEINKDLEKIEKKFIELQAVAGRPFSKTADISSFQNQMLKLGDSVNIVADKFKQVQFKDIDLSKIQGAQDKFKELKTAADTASQKAATFMDNAFKGKMDDSSFKSIITAFQNSFKDVKLDTSSFESSFQAIRTKLEELKQKKQELDAAFASKTAEHGQASQKYIGFNTAKAELEKIRGITDVSQQKQALANFSASYQKQADAAKMSVEEYLKIFYGIDVNLLNQAKATYEQLQNEITRQLTQKGAGSFSNLHESARKNVTRTYDAMQLAESRVNANNSQIAIANKADAAVGNFATDPKLVQSAEEQAEAARKAEMAFEAYKAQILETVNASGKAGSAANTFGGAIASTESALNGAKARLEQINAQMRRMDQMKSRMAMWFGFTRVMSTVRKVVNGASKEIQELDKVMTEIAVVTKMTQEDLWGQIGAYSSIAKQYGVSTRGVYQVSQLYYQQGLQTNEVMQLTTETLKMAKIASLDYSTATDYMTVAIRGFKMEMSDAQVVTDVYSALAAGTASNTKELAIAMSKTASSAEAVGSSFESTSAMIATMIATTREGAENIGSAMKSIISRYGEMTSNPTKLVDSEGEEMSLNRVDKALQSIGITLQTANGQFRDFDDVILELAKKWDTVDRNTQRYIATIMAGNRQQSRFLALVGNYEEYARALDIATNAEDTGTLQTLKTMDSLATKIQQVKTAWEGFYNSMGIEKIAKGGLGVITKMLNSLSKMSKPAAFGTIINLFKGLKTMITGISSGITGVFQKMQGGAQGTINKLNSQLDLLKIARDINLNDANAVNVIKNVANQLRALGAPIPLNIGTTALKGTSVAGAGAATPVTTPTGVTPQTNPYAGLLNFANTAKPGGIPNALEFKGGQVIFNKIDKFGGYNGVSGAEMKAQVDALNAQIKTLPPGTVNNLNDALKVASGEIKGTSENLNKLNDTTGKATGTFGQVNTSFAKTAGILNVFGSALQTAGAMITAHALTITDTSTDEYEKSKTKAAGGSFLSAAGSGISSGASATMMSGNWVVGIIAAIIGMLPGLYSGFSQLIDGFNYTTKERLEAGKAEYEEKKNTATKEKGEATNLENSIENIKKLSETQYDSAEAAKEYQTALNNMGEEYVNLISGYDSAGNAVIDLQKAEEALTLSRYEAAVAARQVAEQELANAKNQKKLYEEASESFFEISLYTEGEAIDKHGRPSSAVYTHDENGDLALRDGVTVSTETRISQWAEIAKKQLHLKGSYAGANEVALRNYLSSELSEDEIDILFEYLNLPARKRDSKAAKEKLRPFVDLIDYDQLINENIRGNLGGGFAEIFGGGKHYISFASVLGMTQEDIDAIDWEKEGDGILKDTKERLTALSEETGISIEDLIGMKLDQLGQATIIEAVKNADTALKGWINAAEVTINSVAESLANTEMLQFTRKKMQESKKYNNDLIEKNIGIFGGLGSQMLLNEMENLGFESISDWRTATGLNEEDTISAVQERIFETIYSSGSESELEKLANVVNNIASYSSIETLKDDISNFSIEVQEALIDSFVNVIDSTKKRAREAIAKNFGSFAGEWGLLYNLFDNHDFNNELIADYSDSVVSSVNLIEQYTKDGLLAKAKALKNSVIKLYTNLGQQSDETQNDVLSIIKAVDWSSSTSIQTAINSLESYAESENVDLSDEIEALQAARDNLAFNLATEVQMMTTAITNGIEGMEKTISAQTKGMGLDDALKAFKTITAQEDYKDFNFDQLFEYDAALKQWVYKGEGFAAAIGTQTKTIEDSYEAANDAYDDFVEFNNEINSSLIGEIGGYRGFGREIGKLRETVTTDWTEEDYKNLYSSLGITGDAFAQGQVKNYLATDRSQTFLEWLDEQVDLTEQQKTQMEAIYGAWGENLISLLSAGIDIEKIMSGTDSVNQKSIIQQIVLQNEFGGKAITELTKYGQNYVAEQVEEIYSAITKGSLASLEAAGVTLTSEMREKASTTPADLADTAIEELLGSVNTVLTSGTVDFLSTHFGKTGEELEKVLGDYGITTDDNGAFVIEEANKASGLIWSLLEVSGRSIEEQNEAVAQAIEKMSGLDKKSKLYDYISKDSLTYSDLAEIASAQGKEFNELFSVESELFHEALKLDNFTGEFEIINFNKYWELLGNTLGENTQEYLEAYSDWVDDQLEESNEIKENAQSQLDDVLDAKLGEQINVSYLEALIPNLSSYLGEIKNGVATIGEGTNIIELVQAIAQAEADGKDILENSVGELRDSIIELIQGWADAISSGLTGELSNTDAEGLKQQFSFITGADFTETKNGLKLSRDAAFELYTELKKIDSVRAGLAFDSIAESLTEAGSGYEDVASTMKTIAKLNKELANVPVSSERRKELERELDVAEEILRVRSKDSDSFSFMDKDLPTGMQGPENYWNSVGDAYKAMNEASSSGYMEIQDYYNIVNQMASMIEASGGTLEWMGMNAENASTKAAELIQKGMSALSNVDGEGVKISLDKLGSSFDLGAAGMADGFADGIKTMAKSQIQMLDAAIRMLEAMVAMENIDANSDGFLELGEIFANGSDLSGGWDKDVIEWADNLEDAAGKIDIGGKSLLDALATLKPEQIQNALNSLMSIDWTLGDTDVAAQIRNVLSAYFPDVDITQGNSVFDILQIPDDADKNAKHFTEWLNKFDLNVKEYNQIKKALDLNSQISTKNDIFKNIEKMLGLEEGDTRFENLYSNLKDLGYGIQDAIKIWDEITVTEDNGKTTYTYNGKDYSDINGVIAARTLKESTGRDVLGKEIKTDKVTGETIYASGTINIGGEEILVEGFESGNTWYSSAKTGARKFKSLNELLEESFKMDQESGSTEMTKAEYFASYGVDITAEGLANVSVEGIKEVLSSDIISQKVQEAGGTKDIVIPIDGKDVTFTAGTSETEIQQKLMEAIGIDASQVETIVSAITTAISTADWSPVGEAIKTALEGSEGEGGLKVAIDSISIDPSKITSATIAEGTEIPTEAIPLDGATVKVKANAADPIEVVLASNKGTLASGEGENAGVQAIEVDNIGIVEGAASGLTVTEISGDATYASSEEAGTIKITGLSSATGEVTTITLTPATDAQAYVNGTLPEAQAGFIQISGSWYKVDISDAAQTNKSMTLEDVQAGEATVRATNYTVTFTNADGTTQSVTVYGQAQLEALLTNAEQIEGKWKISNVFAEADVTLSDSSKGVLEDLKTFFDNLIDKLKNIEITYQEPTPVGPTADPSKSGYFVTGTNNSTGYSGPVGKNKGYFDNVEQVISACTMATETGTFTGPFEITEISAEGVTSTITAEVADLQTAVLNFSGTTYDTSNNSSDGGNKGQGTNNFGVPFDTSVINAQLQAFSDAINTAATGISTATGTLTSIDTTPITTASSRVWSLIAAMNSIKTTPASRIWNLISAINSIPSKKSIGIDYKITVTLDGPAEATGRIRNATGVNSYGLKSASGSLAKGNISGAAKASGSRRTLMGELGPELVVSDGRYYVVGQNGAEFVDLADDAIVFNHLQTQRLLKNGHAGTGKPVTNETKATSLATGNAGPAMASASDALAQLRQIRAMWQALLGASAKDLGSKAGYGGGGGGGGGGGEASKAVLGDLDRWYNLLRQIESLEKHITLEQAKRANMRDGQKYADSLEKELELLRKQQDAYKKLAEYQKRYYDARMQEVNDSQYGRFIFTYDEHGLMQYRESEANADGTIDSTKLRGLDLLAALNETDENGVAKRDAQAQLNLLKEAGFDISILGTNEDGSKAETAEDKMQNFWDNIDGLMEEMDGIYDSYHDALVDSEENLSKINELLQEYIDNQLSVEQKLLQAIQDREQAEIDRLEKEKELLEEASQSYIDGLNEALSKEREMYDKNQQEEETSKLQRRLAILQRSGGSASEIKSLQDQIDSRLKDAYFEEQQSQIDAIQEASDNQIEKLQTQIDIMTEALEYQKENGLLWNEVYNMMQTWTPEAMLAFIEQYTQSYHENSALQNEQDSLETLTELGIYTTNRDREARDAAWNSYYEGLEGYGDEIKEKNKDTAQAAFNEAYATGGLAAAQAAANEVFANAAAAADAGGGDDSGSNGNGTGGGTDEGTEVPEETYPYGKASETTGNIKEGSKGRGVKAVQYALNKLGYGNSGTRSVDGIFGSKTKAAVKNFQKAMGIKADGIVGNTTREKFRLKQYKTGGLVDFTGPAWVDGTKSKPEAFLSASDTAMLKSKIFSNSDGSLKSLVAALEKITNETSNYSSNSSSEQIVIQNAQVNIQPGTISSDYDARRAGELALEEMVKIARKTTNRVVSR